MSWETALELTSLQQNNRQTVTMKGHKILFIWHEEQVHAMDAQCPHLKLPLSKGHITEQCEIVCPFHKSTFDLKTGAVQCWSPWPPVVGNLLGKLSKPKSLTIYPTRIEEGQIQVDLK